MPHIAALLPLAQTGAAPQSSGSGYEPLFLLAGMFAIFYFLLIRPQNKERKRLEELREGLKKGDRVVTQGGLIGTIASLEENEVVLRLNEGRARFLRGAVVSQVEGKGESKSKSEGGAAD